MTKDICLGDITPIIPNDLFKVINLYIKFICWNYTVQIIQKYLKINW